MEVLRASLSHRCYALSQDVHLAYRLLGIALPIVVQSCEQFGGIVDAKTDYAVLPI